MPAESCATAAWAGAAAPRGVVRENRSLDDAAEEAAKISWACAEIDTDAEDKGAWILGPAAAEARKAQVGATTTTTTTKKAIVSDPDPEACSSATLSGQSGELPFAEHTDVS